MALIRVVIDLIAVSGILPSAGNVLTILARMRGDQSDPTSESRDAVTGLGSVAGPKPAEKGQS